MHSTKSCCIFAVEKTIHNMQTINENIKSQMRKGFLEYCILLCLRGNAAYASDIIKSLKEGKFIIVEGTLYPLLTRLKNNGLLTYTWVESTMGPPRKYYSLTDDGLLFLKDLEVAWAEIQGVVNHLKNNPIEENLIDQTKMIKL